MAGSAFRGHMRALVVEDDAGIAAGLQAALKQAGHAVDVCPDARRAWAALCVEPFDVVLLDLGLPDGDGIDLLARLRRQPEPAPGRVLLPRGDTPVIIMTARDGVNDRIGGLDTGAEARPGSGRFHCIGGARRRIVVRDFSALTAIAEAATGSQSEGTGIQRFRGRQVGNVDVDQQVHRRSLASAVQMFRASRSARPV